MPRKPEEGHRFSGQKSGNLGKHVKHCLCNQMGLNRTPTKLNCKLQSVVKKDSWGAGRKWVLTVFQPPELGSWTSPVNTLPKDPRIHRTDPGSAPFFLGSLHTVPQEVCGSIGTLHQPCSIPSLSGLTVEGGVGSIPTARNERRSPLSVGPGRGCSC